MTQIGGPFSGQICTLPNGERGVYRRLTHLDGTVEMVCLPADDTVPTTGGTGSTSGLGNLQGGPTPYVPPGSEQSVGGCYPLAGYLGGYAGSVNVDVNTSNLINIESYLSTFAAKIASSLSAALSEIVKPYNACAQSVCDELQYRIEELEASLYNLTINIQEIMLTLIEPLYVNVNSMIAFLSPYGYLPVGPLNFQPVSILGGTTVGPTTTTNTSNTTTNVTNFPTTSVTTSVTTTTTSTSSPITTPLPPKDSVVSLPPGEHGEVVIQVQPAPVTVVIDKEPPDNKLIETDAPLDVTEEVDTPAPTPLEYIEFIETERGAEAIGKATVQVGIPLEAWGQVPIELYTSGGIMLPWQQLEHHQRVKG